MRIAVIGSGYVGLVTATCLAESGNDVIGMDNVPEKVDLLEKGGLPIYEPGLQELVRRNRRDGRLAFTTDLSQAVVPAEVIFIAVGTPQDEQGGADLRNIWLLADALADHLTPEKIIVIKSTVPPGTNLQFSKRLSQACGFPAQVGSNPEFLKEGAAIDDFMKPDRVVVGVRTSGVVEVLHELYTPFLRTERPFLVMSPESAEMTKYVANAMLATKISFINEMANLCERLGADINDVRRGIGHDDRIGFQFLFPGPGFGGSCFPKDIRALMYTARQNQLPLRLLDAVDRVNEAQKLVLVDKVRGHYGSSLSEKTLAIWGLAFKPRTDDIRDAPSLVLIDSLLDAGVSVRVHDPEAMPNVKSIYRDRLVYCDRPYGALEGVDGLVLVTEWQEFRRPNLELMRHLMRDPVIFDGRNLYESKTLSAHGFTHYSIGRASSKPAPH